MGKKKNDIATREQILRTTIERYIEVETQTINSASVMEQGNHGLLVAQMMKFIRMDSEKHKEMLTTIKSVLEGTISIQPHELAQVDKLLEEHLSIENESIILARVALDNTKNFMIRQLLKYILEDERKHVSMTESVGEYKKKIYS